MWAIAQKANGSVQVRVICDAIEHRSKVTGKRERSAAGIMSRKFNFVVQTDFIREWLLNFLQGADQNNRNAELRFKGNA